MGDLNIEVGDDESHPGTAAPIDWWVPGFLRFALLATMTISFVVGITGGPASAWVCFAVSLTGLAVSYQRRDA